MVLLVVTVLHEQEGEIMGTLFEMDNTNESFNLLQLITTTVTKWVRSFMLQKHLMC